MPFKKDYGIAAVQPEIEDMLLGFSNKNLGPRWKKYFEKDGLRDNGSEGKWVK